MKAIYTPRAPKPAGYYEQGGISGNMLSIFGQLPVDPEEPESWISDFRNQAERVLHSARWCV